MALKKGILEKIKAIHWKFWKHPIEEDLRFSKEDEEVLRKALEMNHIEELAYLQSEEELQKPHSFSPDFEHKMEELFRQHELRLDALGQNDLVVPEKCESKKTKFGKFCYSARIPAVIAAVCFAIFAIGSVGRQTEAIPYPKFTYTLNKEKDCYAYIMEQEKHMKEKIDEKYELTYIPKGYKEGEVQESTFTYSRNIVDKDENVNIYHQCTKKTIIKVDDIIKNYKEIVLEESKYYVSDRQTYNRIVWYANGYQYFIQMNVPTGELVKMAKSLEKQ